jgi:hypothetical protein
VSPTEIIEARSAEEFAEGRILIEEYAETLGVDLCFQNFSDEIESLAKASTRTPKSAAPIVALLFGAGYAKR